MVEFGKKLGRTETTIPGLVVVDLPVHGDSRGWFKENWQREKMASLRLPNLGPVQNNISFNDAAGTTRGIHAEPWDKWVSVATGRIFGAWVDMREGPSFGAVYTTEVDPSRAVYVPRGVGNSYQTLEPDTSYTYLVNDHWSEDASYSFLNLADETVAIPWPIPLHEGQVSAKDLEHPRLAEITPIPERKTLVVGADGQLGLALREEFAGTSGFEYVSRKDFDISSPENIKARRWRDYGVIINAAAYTAVDAAETAAGRREAWVANVTGVAHLARIAIDNGLTLVQVSSDYVFDGTSNVAYTEDDRVCPLSVYGQTKAAADAIVQTVPKHYVARTSWVVGAGKNFVQTMIDLAERGIDPAVVDDQIGRLTFTAELARGIRHLLTSDAEPGIYNITGGGEPLSWMQIARRVYELAGHDPQRVKGVPTAEYYASANGPVAPRPANSVLDLGKLTETGFHAEDHEVALATYVSGRLRPSDSA